MSLSRKESSAEKEQKKLLAQQETTRQEQQKELDRRAGQTIKKRKAAFGDRSSLFDLAGKNKETLG